MEFLGKLSLVAGALSPGLYLLLPFVLLLLFKVRKIKEPPPPSLPRGPVQTLEEFRKRLFDEGTNPSDLLEDCTPEFRELLKGTSMSLKQLVTLLPATFRAPETPSGIYVGPLPPPLAPVPWGLWGGVQGGVGGGPAIQGMAGAQGGNAMGVQTGMQGVYPCPPTPKAKEMTPLEAAISNSTFICLNCGRQDKGKFMKCAGGGVWYCLPCSSRRCQKCYAVLGELYWPLCEKCSSGVIGHIDSI
jgi:hypothetical protein